MPSRNAPCPCGSGLKYKRCCGAGDSGLPPAVARTRALAYQGTLGEQREAFCQKYTAYKQAGLRAIATGLRQTLAARGQTVTCGRGCTACCHVYVVATLQECEAIAYYLYQHTEVLLSFLHNYALWKTAVMGIRDTFQEISRLQNLRLSQQNTPADDDAFDAALAAYTARDIPCPFLAPDGACSIYPVRPYVCAGLVSTTPGEWCRRLHPNRAQAELVKHNVLLDNDMPYFAAPTSKVMLSNLPALVYEILARGWDFLGDVPGLGHLKERVAP